MYNAAFRHLNLDFVYASLDVDDVAGALTAMRILGVRGYSISRPYKCLVLELLDDLDETARSIGAVNVIVNRDGELVGYNSDWAGFMRAVTPKAYLAGKQAAVIGTGGAARAIAYGLRSACATVSLFGRRRENLYTTASDLGVSVGGDLLDWRRIIQADVIVNATPVGSDVVANQQLVPLGVLDPEQIVFDAVYRPASTDLVSNARRCGCTVIDGTEMLLHQAAIAFELFTDRKPPLEVMAAAMPKL